MTRPGLLAACAVAPMVLSACVAIQRAPTPSEAASLRTIAVLPVEAPPLLVHPESEADRAALSRVGLPLPASADYVLIGDIAPQLYLVDLFRGSAALIGNSIPGREDESLTIATNPPSPWMPTPALAATAARLLRDGGREAFVQQGYGQLPIADRSVTYFLENWMGALRRWYGVDTVRTAYAWRGAAPADAVLEVGVLNHEYESGRLLLQVMVKLVDPSTGRVIARAREFAQPRGGPVADMLEDGARPLRDLIDATSRSLLAKCLEDVKLLPR